MSIQTREQLIQRFENGERPSLLFFWGHTEGDKGIDASCLSNWYPGAPFELEGVRYVHAEQWMMAEKARIFGDEEVLAQILETEDPYEAKKLGRQVRNYEDDVWKAARAKAVYRGCLAKFEQNAELGAFLLSTEDRVLVEAAPRDVVWGIGLGRNNEKAQDPRTWRGQNLLGFVLMAVRESLRSSSA